MATATASAKAGTGAGGGDDDTAKGGKGGGKMKMVLIIVVAMVVVAGATAGGVWWFAIRTPPPPPPPEPGVVLPVDPISLNLADGHYLKLGIALQYEYTSDKKATYDGSKALDHAISIFSGRSMDELGDPARREALREELFAEVAESYDGKVLSLYFTEFVMQ